MARRFQIVEHLGDNLGADVESPTRQGVPARLSTVARRTEAETYLADQGFVALSNGAREARLRAWHTDIRMRSAQILQANVNFPILYLASLCLLTHCERIGVGRILFSARDCCLWHELVRSLIKIYSIPVTTEYFYTSRVARVFPSDDYKAYFRSLAAQDGVVIVDVCGTGWSMGRLLQEVGDIEASMFFIHHLQLPKLQQSYNEMALVRNPPSIFSIVSGGSFHNNYLEMANFANHPMVVDVMQINEHFAPQFANRYYDQATREVIDTSYDVFRRALDIMQNFPLTTSSLVERIEPAIFWLYQQFETHNILLDQLMEVQIAEESFVRTLLNMRKTSYEDRTSMSI